MRKLERDRITSMGNELVSIIIPLYNAKKYISDCMECVTGQTYRNLEILLINDGSNDGSEKLCKSYMEKDERIRYFYKNNGGAASARNLGIMQARGKYLYFMDIDDILEKDAIELMYHIYQKHNVDLVIGNVKHISIYGDATSEWIDKDTKFENKDAVRELIYAFANDMKSYKMLYCAWGKLYRTDIVKENAICFNEKICTHEDNVFLIEYIACCNSAYYIGKCLYVYRHYRQKDSDNESYSNTGYLAGPLDFEYVVREVKKILVEKKYNRVISNFYSEYAIIIMFHCVRLLNGHSVHEIRRLYSIIYQIVNKGHGGGVKRAIQYYVQKHDDNAKWIPFFIKRGWIWLIIITFKLQIRNLERRNRKK